MSLEAAMKFVSKIAEDDALRAQIMKAIEGKDEDTAADAFSALGRQHGFVFSAFNALVVYHRAMKLTQQRSGGGELSGDELASVSGGVASRVAERVDISRILATPSY